MHPLIALIYCCPPVASLSSFPWLCFPILLQKDLKEAGWGVLCSRLSVWVWEIALEKAASSPLFGNLMTIILNILLDSTFPNQDSRSAGQSRDTKPSLGQMLMIQAVVPDNNSFYGPKWGMWWLHQIQVNSFFPWTNHIKRCQMGKK